MLAPHLLPDRSSPPQTGAARARSSAACPRTESSTHAAERCAAPGGRAAAWQGWGSAGRWSPPRVSLAQHVAACCRCRCRRRHCCSRRAAVWCRLPAGKRRGSASRPWPHLFHCKAPTGQRGRRGMQWSRSGSSVSQEMQLRASAGQAAGVGGYTPACTLAQPTLTPPATPAAARQCPGMSSQT